MARISDLPAYPLQQVLEVKKRRVETAEQVVKEKQELLRIENEKLVKREQERDKVKNHYKEKLAQLRHEFDEGTTSDKIDQAKRYIKVVQERLEQEEKKVKDQKQQVDVAEKNVEIAKNQLKERRKEEDKIITHKELWTKSALKEADVEEAKNEDDIGSTMFLSKFIQKKNDRRKEERLHEK